MNTFYKIVVLLFVIAIGFSSCEKDHEVQPQIFVVAFAQPFTSYSNISDERKIELVFSKKADFDGLVTVKLSQKNAEYGIDYSTMPGINANNEFEIPIKAGAQSTEFVFKNLIYPFDREDKTIQFEIVKITYPEDSLIQGNSRTMISFAASLGGVIAPEIGGPNQAFQVYVELSSGNEKKVARDSWDLAFSTESDRVKLNGSIYMAVKKLDNNNIDAVRQNQVSGFFADVAIGTFNPVNENYVDSPTGDITKTAIAKISENDADNAVYLVNMGFEPGTAANPSGVDVAGEHRGWKKIRILKRDNTYLLQYANLDDTTHKEAIITKNQAYNFSFFSMKTESVVSVEPTKSNWDLNFTVFTNIIAGSGSYGYSDFVSNNVLGNVKAYAVFVDNNGTVEEVAKRLNEAYNNLVVDSSKFSNDQRVIGAEWRDVFSGQAFKDRFFVIKDAKDNYYKIKMMSMLDENGKRGYPKFEYELIP
ncbi:HmuY family protein [Flavobacterium sp. NKUCC04_CG]|uniref:HmuY family protein n=1 Tax=Flavobacterium sp. NKUCC04_CG TaxID=2842121 RepID=UPI001C5ACDDF|nr:HmuY family protein [Flavobacterium sp. NKUCC04_CG]MBW3517603.1 HmuY family protein [Flavobacterium sp. NKUCC04_CG]